MGRESGRQSVRGMGIESCAGRLGYLRGRGVRSGLMAWFTISAFTECLQDYFTDGAHLVLNCMIAESENANSGPFE